VNADWFYSKDETRLGPVTEDELKRLATDGQLKPADLVWRDGMVDWVEARTVSVLFPPKVEPLPEEGRDRNVRRTLDNAFDDVDRPSRRGRNRDEDEDDDRPRARRRRDEDEDDDRPSRRDRYRDDDNDDRPRPRRSYDDRDDYDDVPRSRRRNQRPGQIQAVGIMMLIGGILGCLVFLSFAASCVGLVWPGIYFELVVAILAIVRGANMLGRDDQGPPKTLAILLIICIVNLDVINCVLGIVCLVMLNAPEVIDYYRRKGFY